MGGGAQDFLTLLTACLETLAWLNTLVLAGARRRDVLYLDLALEAAGRTLIETSIADVKRWAGEQGDLRGLLALLAAALENACLALGSNQELVLCYKDLWVREVFLFLSCHETLCTH